MNALEPGSPEWLRLITASKVPAILGVSPWDSPRSMWHRMHGDLPRDPGNDSTRRGQYLESGVLAWWRDQHEDVEGWTEQPSYTLGDWAAATPDAACSLGLVEAKTAANDSDWGQEGTDEIPDYYLVQTQWQMHVSGITRCYVPVLTSRLRFAEYVVDYAPKYGEALEAAMRDFYETLAADEPPPLDDRVATFKAIQRAHRDIEAKASIELTEAEAVEVVTAQADYKAAEARLRLAKSVVLERMGRAQYADHQGARIARRQPDGPDRTKFVVVGKPDALTKENAA